MTEDVVIHRAQWTGTRFRMPSVGSGCASEPATGRSRSRRRASGYEPGGGMSSRTAAGSTFGTGRRGQGTFSARGSPCAGQGLPGETGLPTWDDQERLDGIVVERAARGKERLACRSAWRFLGHAVWSFGGRRAHFCLLPSQKVTFVRQATVWPNLPPPPVTAGVGDRVE